MKQRMQGFSLVELSVALLALGLVLLGALVYWQLQERQRVSAHQMEVQVQARQAIIGFAYANYRLPCPANNNQGNESCAGAPATQAVGYVPWRTLGLPRPQAGYLRYGVYREATASEPKEDRDLAVLKDRANPMRVPTPASAPQSGEVPKDEVLPPYPDASDAHVLGATQSDPQLLGATQAFEKPLSNACKTASVPPCSPTPVPLATNLFDLCLALNTASNVVPVPKNSLGVKARAGRQSVAFVIAAPGLYDQDGNGTDGRFDGANSGASNTDPTFESPSTPISDSYDDQVVAVSQAELFSQLHCGEALSAAMHTHFNAATAALLLERALYDYRDQLLIAWRLAQADVAAAEAGVASAAAGVADAAKEVLSAVADTTFSAGARAFQIALASGGAVSAGVAVGTAATALAEAKSSESDAKKVWTDFKKRTDAATALSTSISENALIGDAIGY